MRIWSAFLGIVLLSTTAVGEGKWESLFNGRDLAGWCGLTNQAGFSVVDGSIRVQAQGAELNHLFYVGDPGDQDEGLARFKDFELELWARGEPNSNSGIFIHTDRSTRTKRLFLNAGYEIQLNSTAKEKRKTGSLYAVVDLAASPVEETEWFRVNIKVRGKRITVALNGQQVIDYVEPENPKRPKNRAGRLLKPEGGAIALQAHDPESVFFFRDIRLRRLE